MKFLAHAAPHDDGVEKLSSFRNMHKKADFNNRHEQFKLKLCPVKFIIMVLLIIILMHCIEVSV